MSLSEKEAGRFVSLTSTFNVQLLIFTVLPRHRNSSKRISTFSIMLRGFRACTSHHILFFVTLYNIVFVYPTSVIFQSPPSILCILHTKIYCEDPNAQKGNISHIMTPEECFTRATGKKLCRMVFLKQHTYHQDWLTTTFEN